MFQNIFGKDNFYLEMQPSNQEEQSIVNNYIISISQAMNVKLLVTTDAHYLNEEQKMVHKIYLQSSDGEREVDSFYDTTFLMSADKLKSYFTNNQIKYVEEAMQNTNNIMDSIEDIEFEHKPIVPSAHIPDFDTPILHDYADIDWSKYKFIQYYAQSEENVDRYYLKLILDGMVSNNQPFEDLQLSRIDTELDVVKAISDYFGMPMSSYFVLVLEMAQIMWKHSLVGVSRGSASSFYTNYLIGIVQINALEHDLPYWRFLNKDRISNLPDVDLDSEGRQREAIINDVKETFGFDNVINSGTFTTEGTRSAVISAYKGIGLTMNDAQNALDILPDGYSLKDAFYGNEKDDLKPVQKFIDEVEQHENLKKVMLGIEGVVSGRGSHASGVFVMPDGYVNHFGSMKTSSGLTITQFEAHDVEAVGGIKIDFLSIDALDRIRESMDILIDNKKIEDQGSVKATYDKYLHPNVIDIKDPVLYDTILKGDVPHIFQFATGMGRQGVKKVQPQNFGDLEATNTLIRMTTKGEQLIDRYIRYRDNPQEWEDDMIEYGLNESERKTLHRLLDKRYGINDTQEFLMMIVMDENISNFTLKMANKMRKSVAKKNPKLQEEQKKIFFEYGKKNGTRQEMLDYVWQEDIVPQLSYSFSLPHVSGYTLIAIIETYISAKYGAIYWKAANLNVDAGTTHGFELDSIKYAEVARGVVNARETAEIELPSVNGALYSFTITKDGKIAFPIGAISSVNQDLIERIENNRPFKKVMEFVSKVEPTDKQMSLLIKAGAFHEFINDNNKLAQMWLMQTTDKKKKLTTIQLPRMMNQLPKQFEDIAKMYQLKSMIWGRNKVPMNEEIEKEYLDKYSDIDYDYEDGKLVPDKKKFDKEFNKRAEPLKDWLKTEEAIDIIFYQDLAKRWDKLFTGNQDSWYFEALSFYPGDHELLSTPVNKLLGKFENLPETPERKSNGKFNYVRALIAGTVLQYNSKKGVATIYTTSGSVIEAQIGKGRASYYAHRVAQGKGKNRHVVDDSWFKRNEKIGVIGYRRGEKIQANNMNTDYPHAIIKINGYGDNAYVQLEKMKED